MMKCITAKTLLATSALALALWGCGEPPQEASTPARTPTRAQSLDPVPCVQGEHDEIRLKLAPHCAGCHGPGTSAPYFASVEAFESLIVRNPRFITPGDPDSSEFIRLLEGKGTGAFTQMPTAGSPYAALSAEVQQISMAELRQWVTGLTLAPLSDAPDPNLPTTRRLGADEIRGALMAQLGLSFEQDFLQQTSSNHDSPTIVLKGAMPLYSPSSAPGLHYRAQSASAAQRWIALGGDDWLDRQVRRYDISPSFLQTVTQLSQAWCELAVNKADNQALFKHVQPNAKSADAADDIKANIGYLHLRMLALPADATAVTKIYEEVFLAHEPEGSKQAWIAVCSYFVRHPLWLSL